MKCLLLKIAKNWMGLFANRMDLSSLLFIGKQMPLGMFLSLAGKNNEVKK